MNSEIKDLEKGKKDLLEKYKELELEKDEMSKHAKTLKAEVVSKEVEVIRSKGEKEDAARKNKQLIEVLKGCNANAAGYSTHPAYQANNWGLFSPNKSRKPASKDSKRKWMKTWATSPRS